MTSKPLEIAFLWHMHQPCYKDPFSGLYQLPWVRLHGVKDYLDTLKILDEFPDIRQTFNVVPSLLEQLIDYTDHGAKDRHLELTLRHPDDLTQDEKVFILEHFFLANWDTMVKPFSRYHELLQKRGMRFSHADAARMTRYFSAQDFRDIQALFNITWIDPMFRREDPFLRELVAKEKDYTEEDKALLIGKQLEILREIIPTYRKMSDAGRIELSVTPFYHPILPLLWDTDHARRNMPQIKLPKRRFSHPEDAEQQIQMAVDFFEETFGHRPVGMWPSEGSVSEEVAGAIASRGFTWIATDEEVLARSLDRPMRDHNGRVVDPKALYQPHRIRDLSLFFRDRRLSDQIGFVYSGMTARQAVDDFIGRLAAIKESLPDDRSYVVPVILDGENAWEYYPNDGHDFLRCLYDTLRSDRRFRTVTMSEYIAGHGKGDELPRLHTGSWINANFGIWIGHDEDNLAWDYLGRTRDDLTEYQQMHPDADLLEAWRALYAAEGSDWNWWYGDDHSTETQDIFDSLFRSYLLRVYDIIGKEPPHELHEPIMIEDRVFTPEAQVRGFVHPTIDGSVTSYFEWYNAAFVAAHVSGGSMHKSEGFISGLYYGFNRDNLCLRIDPQPPLLGSADMTIQITLLFRTTFRMVIAPVACKASFLELSEGKWHARPEEIPWAFTETLELTIPFGLLGAKEGDEIRFSVEVVHSTDLADALQSNNGIHEREIERCPWKGFITVTVPPPDYEKMMWY